MKSSYREPWVFRNQPAIVVTVIGVITAVIVVINVWAYLHGHGEGARFSVGLTGVVETRCVDGYKFTVSGKGYARQVFDAEGHGVPCP